MFDVKSVQIFAVVFVVCAVAALWTGLAGCNRTGTDAVSQASHVSASKSVLPPEADTYEVLGWQDGMAGYAVKYDEKFYRGGMITGKAGMEALKKWGVKTIVSVTPTDDERKFSKLNGMTLVEVPFGKDPGVTPEVRETFLRAVRTGEGPFYVHCHGGSHRAGTLGALYRMEVEGWDFDKAAVEFGRLGGDLKTDHALLESIRPKR